MPSSKVLANGGVTLLAPAPPPPALPPAPPPPVVPPLGPLLAGAGVGGHPFSFTPADFVPSVPYRPPDTGAPPPPPPPAPVEPGDTPAGAEPSPDEFGPRVELEDTDLDAYSVALAEGRVLQAADAWFPGVTGHVHGGIWELERIIGRGNVIDDFALASAGHHVSHSAHYTGDAVDFEWLRWIWDLLWPIRAHLRSLLGPPGLFEFGTEYHSAAEYAQHSGEHAHIHVTSYLSIGETDALLHVRPGESAPQRGQPGSSPAGPATAPRVPAGVVTQWRGLVDVFAVTVPERRHAVDSLAKSLVGVFK